jgi:hypothetical protein
MAFNRNIIIPVIRAVFIVLAGAVVLSSVSILLHHRDKPYYAQLASQAVDKNKIGVQDGYIFLGTSTK